MSDQQGGAAMGVDSQIRVATDVGGTFTDLVTFGVDEDSGAIEIRIAKAATTPPDFDLGVLDVFDRAEVPFERVESHVHGTTVVINAITERKGAKVGLIGTEGFRDTLEIARGNRPDFFNLGYRKPEPFVPRYLRREVPGRMSYQGEQREPLDLAPVAGIVDDFRADGVEAIAICLLHSWANPAHERRLSEEVRRLWPEVAVVVSSDITREWREYERTSTAVLSAYVQPVAQRYLGRLDEQLRSRELGGPTLVMQSNCGVASAASVAEAPIMMVESGPASGFLGAAELGRRIGRPDVLALDIGGTTAKCSLIEDGRVRVMTDYWLERDRESAGYPAMVPVVDLVEIGNGGGSIAWVDDFGKLHVGPQSAGADPGPASYGQGGSQATTTDANLWLGRISRDDFCGGEIVPDLDATERALTEVGARMGVGPTEAARGIVRIANNNMVNALKLISLNRGHDPRDFTLVAFGGGGPMHALALADELGVQQVVVPSTASVFSAWGMIVSDLRHDYFHTVLLDVDRASVGAIAAAFSEAERQAVKDFVADAVDAGAIRMERFGRFRYQGQEHTTEVALDADDLAPERLAGLTERFHAAYEAEYTYRLDAPIEMVGLHLVASVPSAAVAPDPQPPGDPDTGPARIGTRTVDFAELGIHEAALLAADALRPGMTCPGPAVVEGAGTSVLVHPGWTMTVDGHRNLVLDADVTPEEGR
ncbi:MAG: hydantoinase/oxoprolinase family protein [Actinomycetota bacterium]